MIQRLRYKLYLARNKRRDRENMLRALIAIAAREGRMKSVPEGAYGRWLGFPARPTNNN